MTSRTLLFDHILDTCDYLEDQGVDVSPVIKRRDPTEPGRRRKEKAEDDLFSLMMSYFRAQSKHIKEYLGNKWPTRKQVETPPELAFILADFNGDPFMKKMKLLLMKAARDGVLLFSELVPIGIDYTLVNTEAAVWAAEYAGELITGIDETTLNDVRSAVSMFIQTPGMTIGDTMSALSITGMQREMRSLRIAVTEITNAYATAEQLAGEQLQEEFPDVRVIKRWWTNNDDLVCPICGPLHGKIVGIGEKFSTDLGEGNIVVNERPPAHPNCLPGDTNILSVGGIVAGSKRWYEGNIIVIETLENKLTVTPNHPILTPSGWVAAGKLEQGDNVLGYTSRDWKAALVDMDNNHRVTTIEDVFSAFDLYGFRMPTAAPHFHGDGAGSDVAVIRANSKVVDNIKVQFAQPPAKYDLTPRDVVSKVAFSGSGAQTKFIEADLSPAGSLMRTVSLLPSLFGGHSIPFGELSFTSTTRDDIGFEQTITKSPPIDPGFLCEGVLGFAAHVASQEIVKIWNYDFTGHVYNLQTTSNLFVAAGIITHNCRCWLSTTTQIGETQ